MTRSLMPISSLLTRSRSLRPIGSVQPWSTRCSDAPGRLFRRNEGLPVEAVPCQQGFVGLDIISRHASDREAMLERLAGRPHRLSVPTRRAAVTASSIVSTMKPLTPSAITSGTEPLRKAITGVPADIASIITRPKGSGQSIGNSSARACPRKSHLALLVDLADELDQRDGRAAAR